jgi:hypothetical protein
VYKAYDTYISTGKELANAKNLDWDFPVDAYGCSKTGWNLTQLIGDTPPPTHYLRDFGPDSGVVNILDNEFANAGKQWVWQPIDKNWQELIKASTCEYLLLKRKKCQSVKEMVIRPLKVLATCCLVNGIQPWDLNGDTINEAIRIAKIIQPVGKLADLILSIINNLFDTNHLAIRSPLYPALGLQRNTSFGKYQVSKSARSKEWLLDSLEKRKSQEKLPEKKAFWELVRIVFTERPASFVDAIRFAAIKVMIITGLRLGEAVRLPNDWKRIQEYYDPDGTPAGELGGHSQALLLRYFAEKQPTGSGVGFYENTQYVPRMFETILIETLDEITRLTQPLRETLKLQCESNRLLPWYGSSDLIPATELYTRLTGNPIWLNIPEDIEKFYSVIYRHSLNPCVIHQLLNYQADEYKSKNIRRLNVALYVYFKHLVNHPSEDSRKLQLRTASGSVYPSNGYYNWRQVYVHIGELEAFLAKALPTKLPDMNPFKLASGETLQPWEFLFLTPKRSLSEKRDGGMADVTRYYSVGIPDNTLLTTSLGEKKEKFESLFQYYGKTDADKSLVLISHSLRHLQNTELFRVGIADTVITKRFNRHSVAQSHVYDHRSLAESLDPIELPDELEAFLGEKAATVAKLIQAERASGPIVNAFKTIQAQQGSDAAFEFLRTEADGFHVTPYGHCINSFTVDPCPKNLECFAGCRHLMATGLPEHRKNLQVLEHKFKAALDDLNARPSGTEGHANQIAHASVRLAGIRQLLTTPEGGHVFPNGPDLSAPDNRSVLDG